MNPYDPPGTDSSVGGGAPTGNLDFEPGTLDIGLALSDGWDATKRNFGVWLLMGLTLFVVILLLECTLIGLFIAGPPLMWGAYKYSLDVLDGKPAFNVLFSGFGEFGKTWVGMAGSLFFMMLAMIPAYVLCYGAIGVGFAAQMAVDPNSETPLFILIGTLVGVVVMMPALIPMLKLYLAPYFVVDQGMGPLDACKASWKATRGNMLSLIGLFVAIMFIVIIGELALLVGVIPAIMVQYGALSSAYRQMAGRHPGRYADL